MFHHLFPNNRLLLMHVITTISSLIAIASTSSSSNSSVSTLPHPHPDLVAIELQMQVESSRRRALSALKSSRKDQQCLTGNPIDDCWRCSGVDWLSDRQRLADCGIGFGRGALGGKGGSFYVVTDPSDGDAVNPAPGTLRYGALQDGPLWITFAGDMTIRLNQVLMVNSLKTIDGRGAEVHIAGGACITIQEVSNVIIHNVHVHDCVPAGGANVRSSPNHYEWRSKSDGDGISIHSSRNVWVDHCSLSNCADGLIDVTVGSTGITISNSFFSHHDKVMLLGHSDDYTADSGMQVTVAFNRFGQQLVQRMPRCRFGYFHVVNNDYTGWEMYAVGGSANPTINSQGNRYIAPADSNAKEVTKRVDTDESQWEGWDWRSEGDVMVNGAYFVASGQGMAAKYAMASSVEPLSAALIDQLTMNAGVLGAPGDKSAGTGYSGGGGPTNSGGNAGTGYSGGVADGGEPTNSGVNAGGGSVGSTPVYGYGPYYGPQYGPFGMVFHSGASRSYGLLFFGICCTYILPFFSLLREL